MYYGLQPEIKLSYLILFVHCFNDTTMYCIFVILTRLYNYHIVICVSYLF